MPHNRRRPRTLLWLVLAVVMTIFPAGRVLAQGTMGMLPDPMTTTELMRDLDRLDLSPEQKQAAQRLHAQYRDRFAVLHDNDIKELMQQMGDMSGTLPERAKIEKLMSDMDRVQRKIAGVDNRFLDELQIVLTDEQRAGLERIRLRRERARYRQSALNFAGGGTVTDISEIVDEIELSPDTRTRIAPTLEAYEFALTRDLRDVAEASARTIISFFDALDEAGLAEDALQNPETAAEAMKVVVEAQKRMFVEVEQRSLDMFDKNRKAVKALAASMTDAEAMRFRAQFVAREEQAIGPIMLRTVGWWSALHDFEPTDDAERETVNGARNTIEQTLAPIITELMKTSVARASMGSLDPDAMSARQTYFQRLGEITSELATSIEEARAQLAAGLAPTRVSEIAASAEGGSVDTAVAAQNTNAGGEEDPSARSTDILDAPPVIVVDNLIIGRIRDVELRRYAGMLGVDDDTQKRLDEAHAAYAAQYDAMEERMRTGYGSVPSYLQNEDGQFRPNPAFDVEAYHTARRQFAQEARDLDDAFLEQVRTIVDVQPDDAAWKRIVDHRLRRRMSPAFNAGMGVSSQEASIELGSLLRHLEQRNELSPETLEVLRRYEAALTPLYVILYDRALTINKATDRWQIKQQEYVDGAPPVDVAESYRAIFGNSQQQFAETLTAIVQLNLATIDELQRTLPDDEAERMRDRYFRIGFPQIYSSGQSAHRALRRSLRLPNLSVSQREQLEELASTFFPAFDAINDQLVDATRQQQPWLMFNQDTQQEWMARQRRSETLKYERRELEANVITTLSTTLDPDQLRQVGGLPALPKKDPRGW
ncbi:MAG: hypothetical protein KC983_03855 [Phycisphaerales bacterium]|nr:hypothetical protein [Phycisphaerales bacterium]